MNPSTRTKAKSLLRVIVWLSFAAAGLAFVFGGGIIHAIRGTERILAEIEGMAIALLSGGLGFVAKDAEDRLEESEVDPNGPKSLGDALRK